MEEDFYKILGVPTDASQDRIKKAYRKLSKTWHPDRNQGDEEATEKFKTIAAAYEILSDDQKRRTYDLSRSKPFVNKANFPTFVDPRSAQFQNKEASSSGSRTFYPKFTRKVDTRETLEVSLEKIYTGCVKHIPAKRGELGSLDGSLQVKIPAGAPEGWECRFEGKGKHGGVLTYVLKSKLHRRFERSAENLICKYKITLRQALCGFEMKIPTLAGQVLTKQMTEIVRPGYRYFLADEGLPRFQSPGERGYLIVEFEIEFPTYLGDEQRKQIGNSLKEDAFWIQL